MLHQAQGRWPAYDIRDRKSLVSCTPVLLLLGGHHELSTAMPSAICHSALELAYYGLYKL